MQIELEILKNVQRCHFPEEFKVLSKSKNVNCVKKSSSLWSLDSVLVDSLLRVGCSLASASIPMESKHQIILPKKDHVTNLMAKHYHIISGYSGREYVLSVVHKRFWVIKLLEEFFPNGDKDKAFFACRRWLIFQQFKLSWISHLSLTLVKLVLALSECAGTKVLWRGTGSTAEEHQMHLQYPKWFTFRRYLGMLHLHYLKDSPSPALDANYWHWKFVNSPVRRREYNEWMASHHSFNWPRWPRSFATELPASL